MKAKFIIALVGLIAFSFHTLIAQEEEKNPAKNYNTWSAGISVGHLAFYGDISQYDYFKVWKYNNENRIGGALTLNKQLSNVISLQGQVLLGSLAGTRRGIVNDVNPLIKGKFPNGVYFKTNIIEGNISALMNLSNVAFTPRAAGKHRKMNIYLFVGHGLVRFDSQAYDLQNDRPIMKYKAGLSGKTTEAVNPMGLILAYEINKQFDVNLAITMRRANSDKLDGYVRGSSPDYYGFTAFGLVYKFGSGNPDAKSLDWINPMEEVYNELQEMKVIMNQIMKDDDDDGVANYFDKEENTPAGTIVDGSGTAMDMDDDGVLDGLDEDPFTPAGATVDPATGKAIDSDGDGVPDGIDLEPDTKPGELVNFQGKKIEGGFTTGGSAIYFPSVYFNFNGSSILGSNSERIASIARTLKSNPNIKVTLTGHADNVGSETYNEALGLKRAQKLADYLVNNYGIDAARLNVISKGETETLSDKFSNYNRRVDVN
ncbi:MAG: OmpA family protein [Bacteroidetes bacterium]|nr:OmpA family protein [Bacteroidota bacterium]